MSEIPADVSKLADDILMSINWQHIPTQDYAHAKDVITRAIMGDRASRPPVVKDGWVMVPKKPTEEMMKNAAAHHEGESWLPYSLWQSMLAAAPTPPSDALAAAKQEAEHAL